MATDRTKAEVDKMTPPMLRKAIKDAGHDPMSATFGKGDVNKMKEFLYPKAVASSTKPLPPKPKPAAPSIAERHPALDAAKASVQQVPASSQKSWQETVELRLATIEAKIGLSHATLGPMIAPPAASKYDVLKDFLRVSGDGDVEVLLEINQVQTLSLEQKLLTLELLGDPQDAKTSPRILSHRIVEGLNRLAKVDGTIIQPPAPPKKAAASAPRPATTSGVTYKVGDLVLINYEGEEFEGEIEAVTTKRGVSMYTVFFPKDQSEVTDIKQEEIIGYK